METTSGRRLPRSGSAALAAAALVQAVLGIEFVLTGLSKVADSGYVAHFGTFIAASPGSHRGLIAPLVQAVVVPHLAIAAELAKFGELAVGVVLLVAAAETARRRVSGRFRGQHRDRPAVALAGGRGRAGGGRIPHTLLPLPGRRVPARQPG